METRGVVAEWDAVASRMIVNGATKVTFFNRRTLAAMMQMPESAIDLIELDVGGGFGVRGEFYPEDFLIPFVARKLNRPVKWIEDRLEHLQAANHSREIDCELEIACRRDGTISACAERSSATWVPIRGPIPAWCRQRRRSSCTGPTASRRSKSRLSPL